ncbi:hypothetical protein LCGC14_1306610 [marine sediment metagenome]|uniref:Uncharacterized protein n=1 Tax=marine sediment metagenome TaxID=412755 RepID=A0A0F9NR15_9ZZZZ
MPSIIRGTTDVTRSVVIVDNSDGSPETGATITNFAMQYTRAGEAPVAVVDPIAALATTSTAHTDNRMIEIDATDSPGLYRVDWPDAAFVAGASSVTLVVTSSDAFQPAYEEIELTAPVEFATGAAISTPPKDSPDGFAITFGEAEANTEDSTHALDGTTHDIRSQLSGTEKIDVYYEFTVGGDGIPTGVKAHHQLDKGGGTGKNLQVYAYNWGTPGWDQIGLLESSTALETDDYTLFAAHVGSGTDNGKVRIRYETGSVAFTATTTLLVDQILVEYTIVSRSVGYEGGQIWIDTGATNTNTEEFVDGVADNPVSTIGAAITLSGTTGLTDFHILNGSSITLAAPATNYSFFGDNWTLDLNGQSCVGIHVEGAAVVGAMAGTGANQSFRNCELGAMSLIKDTHLESCRITGTQTLIEAGDVYYEDCHSGVSGSTAPTLDFGGALANSGVHFRNYSGGLQIENMGDVVTDTLDFEGIGHLIEGTCTAGTVTVRGMVSLSGITNLTITEVARVAPDRIADYSGRVFSGTSTASSTTTKVYVQAGDTPSTAADDDFNDMLLVVYDTGTRDTARVNIRAIDNYDDSDPSFTISPALAFTPGSGDLVEVWQADTGTLSLLNTLASGFSGASPNRLIDHLRSIMSKGAVTPSSLGTYDPAADSLEFASDRRALIEGSGFDTSTDSLKEIRDAIDTLVAPAVVSASSLSGSGFLSDVVSLVRKATDEPSQSPKYTDGDIVEYIQAGMDAVMTDIAINTDHPIVVRYSITLVDGTQYYVLPPNVAELIRVAKINSTTGLPEYEAWPGSYMNPGGAGWKLEGNVLRLLRDWNSTDTLELMYYPNSEPAMHKATASSVAAGTITFPSSVTDGTLGTRPNEYVGMLCRILSSDTNLQEERLITGYVVSTRVATLAKDWDTTPIGTIVYEVVPIFSRTIKHVVALRTAIDILSNEGNSQRMATLNQNYAIKLSAMRRQLSKMEGRFPHHFDGDTWDNTNRGGF